VELTYPEGEDRDMLELILLIAGVVYAVRRPRLSRLTPGLFPNVDREKFAEWKDAELRSTDVFLLATWGAFAAKIGLLVVLSQTRTIRAHGMTLTIALVVAWFVGLAAAAILGSKAKKLKKAAGIRWPN
jgi:hypothetical protein